MTRREGILAYEPDLVFSSRLESSVRKMGGQVMLVTDQAKLLEELTRGIQGPCAESGRVRGQARPVTRYPQERILCLGGILLAHEHVIGGGCQAGRG
jgi:hypothetical protein